MLNIDFPSRSYSVTVITSLWPSIATWPKNWKPSAGDVLAAGGAAANTVCGPKVVSSAFGPNAPAFSGPETNSQNGVKSPIAARAGS